MVGPAMAATSHGASYIAAPSNSTSLQNQIILLMTGSAAVIFYNNAKTGKPQSGNQYIAIGVVGFILLFISEFWAEMAYGIAILFFVVVLLNSPNGVPIIAPTKNPPAATPAGQAAPIPGK